MKSIELANQLSGQNASSLTERSAKMAQQDPAVGGPEKLREIARDFESIFVELLLGSMRKAVPQSGFINGGNAEDIYKGMLDSEYAKIIAKQDHTGLAMMIEKQLLQMLGKSQRVAPSSSQATTQGLQAYKGSL